MTVTHVVGIDPGIVHTGAVRLVFEPDIRCITQRHLVLPGCNPTDLKDWAYGKGWASVDLLVVESYRPRGNVYSTDTAMRKMVDDIKREMPRARVLDNTGVKKIVTQDLMDLLGVWTFSTPTHHQDLRSAARIALLAMLKDDVYNALIAQVVRDHLDGQTWRLA